MVDNSTNINNTYHVNNGPRNDHDKVMAWDRRKEVAELNRLNWIASPSDSWISNHNADINKQ
jgi:hypothetical protein